MMIDDEEMVEDFIEDDDFSDDEWDEDGDLATEEGFDDGEGDDFSDDEWDEDESVDVAPKKKKSLFNVILIVGVLAVGGGYAAIQTGFLANPAGEVVKPPVEHGHNVALREQEAHDKDSTNGLFKNESLSKILDPQESVDNTNVASLRQNDEGGLIDDLGAISAPPMPKSDDQDDLTELALAPLFPEPEESVVEAKVSDLDKGYEKNKVGVKGGIATDSRIMKDVATIGNKQDLLFDKIDKLESRFSSFERRIKKVESPQSNQEVRQIKIEIQRLSRLVEGLTQKKN